MKILHINDKNAKSFDKQVDNNIVFAKYFSPSCPACIAIKGEWESMCKDIEAKYNTDLLLAEIDPNGMSSLENTHTYSDVDYVPHIVILKNGKKIDEYNGPKTKDKMIEYLINGGYLKHKMSGGKYKRRGYGRTRRSKKGSGQVLSDESVISADINNELINVPEEHYIETIMRENTINPLPVKTVVRQNDYEECVNSGIFNDCKNRSCRKSRGFYNKCIPKNRKFNPNTSDESKTNAENSYKRLIMLSLFKSKEVHNIIKSNFPEKLNKELTPIKNQIEQTILNYDYGNIDINDISKFTEILQHILENDVGLEGTSRIDSTEALSHTLQNKLRKGGKRKNKTMRRRNLIGRTRRRNCCIGKKDGKSGCRTCCKSRRNMKRCITRCMRGPMKK